MSAARAGVLTERMELQARLRSVLEAGAGGALSEAEFGALAVTSAAYQAEAIPAYGAYCRHLGFRPRAGTDWRGIPPVPASAFKSHDLSAAPPGQEQALFETSGTTISRPGRVRLWETRLYERSLLAGFDRHLLPDGARLRAIVFGPTRAEAPRSSLWFMVDRVVARFSPSAVWIVEGGEPRWEIADQALTESRASQEPVLLLGTTLLFAAYFKRLDALGREIPLPEGSRVMDTGGAKGLRTEFTREEIEEASARLLGIPGSHLINEYGMAELSSQFYDENLLAAVERRPAQPGKRIPPWVRTRVLDPETMSEVPEGAAGLLVHYDLANLDVPLAVQTEDVGLRHGDRLFLERRLARAEARGCSLRFEQFLVGERGRAAFGRAASARSPAP